jgi:hypothetical protein
MGSADPHSGAFYEALWPFSGVFPLFLCPQRETLTVQDQLALGHSRAPRHRSADTCAAGKCRCAGQVEGTRYVVLKHTPQHTNF